MTVHSQPLSDEERARLIASPPDWMYADELYADGYGHGGMGLRLLATIEADRERISQLEEAADIVLEVEARGLRDIRLRSSSEGAWLSAISVLRHARG